jgi:hypothetical protein
MSRDQKEMIPWMDRWGGSRVVPELVDKWSPEIHNASEEEGPVGMAMTI